MKNVEPLIELVSAIIEQGVSDLKLMSNGRPRPRGTKWAFSREHFDEFFGQHVPTLISLSGLRLDPEAIHQKLMPQIQKLPV